MKVRIGVWIDHREAIVVKLTDSGQEVICVQSDFETQLRRSSDRTTGNFEPMMIPADTIRERKKVADLKQFYDEVSTHLGNAQSLLIFGPGEAKTEFRKHLGPKHSAAADLTVETADKMTEPQVVARVREHFQSK